MFVAKCLAGGRGLGRDQDYATFVGAAIVGSHTDRGGCLLCRSVGALWEVIFESTLTSFFPSHLEAQQFHFNHVKENKKASD